MSQNLKTTASKVNPDEVAKALRSVIEVRQPDAQSLLTNPAFWDRCRLLPPDALTQVRGRIFVDGFAGCCHWNSWKVYTQAIENGLSLWLGYAFYDGVWTSHCWCMLQGRIVETTWAFRIYFGAELSDGECDSVAQKYGKDDPLQKGFANVYTIRGGHRMVVPYDAESFANSIGRERDWKTLAVKEGLGR